ncbi:MAG: hypothetical protein DRJ05_06145 [Bacteroidetes bacterium]|nr:MAG: hypothetical protein DRJ05_06145 [Bacteroidota bacterium]
MVKIGLIVEGNSELIVYKSPSFIKVLDGFNLSLLKVVTPGGRPNFFRKEQIEKYCNELFDEGADKVFLIIDKETGNASLSEIKEKIYNCNTENQILIIQVMTLESWFLADSVALSKAFKKKFSFDYPEKVDNPYLVLKNEFISKTGIGLGPKESTMPAQKMVRKFGFSIENVAKHPNCPSAKYFLKKLSELNPNP